MEIDDFTEQKRSSGKLARGEFRETRKHCFLWQQVDLINQQQAVKSETLMSERMCFQQEV